MIWNNLKTAYRNLVNYRGHSIINIAGLTIGITIFFLIMMFIRHELSYDRNLSNYDRIYKLVLGDVSNQSAIIAPLLQNNFPEITNTCRFYMEMGNNPLISYKEKNIKIANYAYVDSTFLSMFSFPILSGNSKDALTDLNTIVLTESVANNIFGTEDPIGKIIRVNDSRNLKVTAVLKDLPDNSTFQFSALVSMATFETVRNGMNNFGNFWFNTYVLVADRVDKQNLQDKMNTFLAGYLKTAFDFELTETFFLYSLGELYFKTGLRFDSSKHGNYYFVRIFLIVGIVVLIIAVINFVNLSSAKSSLRAKEIGIRKVLGSFRTDLIKQFLLESTILALISTFLALIMVELIKPFIIQLTGFKLEIGYIDHPIIMIYILLFSMILGLILGFFPALILSSLKITHLFKNLSAGGKGGKISRSILIVFQFSISMILIICTIVIARQIHYLKNKELGYNKENVIFIEMGRSIVGSYESFKQELLQNPNIAKVSFSLFATSFPNIDNLGRRLDEQRIAFDANYVDDDYLDLFDIDLVEGRNFSREIQSDRNSHAVIFNETAIKMNKLENPVGKEFVLFDTVQKAKIVGVMKDFHYKSLHQDIGPLALIFSDNVRIVNVKLSTPITNETINYIKDLWSKFFPTYPFEYKEMESYYQSFYNAETQLMRILIYFTIFAIFIACLGLFGLVSFITERRSKEIGIRKVHGASILTIVFLISKDISKWIAIAFVIACPLGFWFSSQWLTNFPYQTNIPWWIYVITGILGLLIGLLTLSFEAYKAAIKNPVESIRYE